MGWYYATIIYSNYEGSDFPDVEYIQVDDVVDLLPAIEKLIKEWCEDAWDLGLGEPWEFFIHGAHPLLIITHDGKRLRAKYTTDFKLELVEEKKYL